MGPTNVFPAVYVLVGEKEQMSELCVVLGCLTVPLLLVLF